MNAELKKNIDHAINRTFSIGNYSFGGYGSDSYCLTYNCGKLRFSLGTLSGKSDKEVEIYLSKAFGKPTDKYSQMSSLSKELTLFFMEWDNVNPDTSSFQLKSVNH